MTSSRVAARTSASPVEVGAAHEPLDLDLGDDDGLGARALERDEGVGPVDARSPPPTPARRPRGPSRRGRWPRAARRPPRPRAPRRRARGRRCPSPRGPRRRRRARAPPSSVRTPPPACTGTSTAAAIAAMRWRLAASPVRAASRSTVWIQGAPAATKRLGHRDGSSPWIALAVEVALHELHDAAAAQVDGRVEVHQPTATATRPPATNVRSAARPVRLDFSGWNCVAHTGAPLDGGDHRAAVVARGARRSRDRCRPRTSGRSRPTPGRARRRAARHSPRRSSRFHCICGRFTPSGSRRTVPGQHAEARRRPGDSSEPSKSSCMPMQMPRNGTPRSTASRATSSSPWPAERGHAAAERADAGQHHAGGLADEARVGGEAGVGADVLQRLLGRAQVADLVVEDGDEGHRDVYERALGGRARRRPRPAPRRAGSGPRP